MYVVIVGGGMIGDPLSSSLIAAGHEVFVIDRDPGRVAILQKRLGSIATVGDGTSVNSLTEAGTARASLFIATTGNDEDNLAACQLARSEFNVPRTVAVASYPENVQLFGLSGVDVVASATDLVLANIAGALPAHPLVRLMPVMGRSQEIVGIKIPGGATVVGKPLKEVGIPYGAHVALIIGSNGRTEAPKPDTVLESEDEIIALSPVESTRTLWETLTELR
ncbi:MAG: TrkA family potassium uptake protein [Dehalococcoidia bacterium]